MITARGGHKDEAGELQIRACAGAENRERLGLFQAHLKFLLVGNRIMDFCLDRAKAA